MKDLVGEVRDFLQGLKAELPALFAGRVHKRVPYRGRDVELRLIEEPALRRSEIVQEGEVLYLKRGSDRAAPQQVLREWMIDRARETFAERAAHFAARLGVKYARLAVRDQRTVWGSCTQAGVLNFNWRLIMAPPATLDYLVIHELSHLHEMNHSKRFWAHVAAHCPDWKVHRAWLRDHSLRLKSAVRRSS